MCLQLLGCTSYYEGTELKANHNLVADDVYETLAVLALTNVLNSKQITPHKNNKSLELKLY